MSGLALGSGVSLETLMRLFLEAPSPEQPPDPFWADSEAVAQQTRDRARRAMLRRTIWPTEATQTPWLVRTSRPEVGFRSVELTVPWSVAALAGVNQAGLAVALVPRTTTLQETPGAEPTPALLVQECLQRFEQVDAGLEWCLKRPSSGPARVVLCDAQGAMGAVELCSTGRRVLGAVDGLLVLAARGDRELELRKQRGASHRQGTEPLSNSPGGWIEIDPAGSAFTLHTPGRGRRGASGERFSV